MSMQVCVVGSGSKGNAILVASASTRLLVDAGLSAREIERRLDGIGVKAADLDGICLTHEHNDHSAGIRVLQRRFQVPLYANRGTAEALMNDARMRELDWKIFDTGNPFEIGDLTIEPFSVPHDAYEPVGFVVRREEDRVGIATDVGMPTGLIRQRLKGCRVLVVESNHDEHLLQEADRPWVLRQRIMGRQGHLSNRTAAALLVDVAGPELEQVFLVHLSEDCNRPDLAARIAREALQKAGFSAVRVSLSYADRVSDLWPEKSPA